MNEQLMEDVHVSKMDQSHLFNGFGGSSVAFDHHLMYSGQMSINLTNHQNSC